MNKPPAFQFYADDFLAGTFDMSIADVGAYIRLLCHQWNRGSIPVEPERQNRLAGGVVSDEVRMKFKPCRDGLLRNARLEMERQKQEDFRRKQSEKGVKSGKSRREQRLNHGSVSVEPRAVEPKTNFPSPTPSPITPIPPNGELLTEAKKEWKPTQEQLRLGALFGRKPTTRWHHNELKAWRHITPVDESDLQSLEDYYGANIPHASDYRRHDLATLLNNFTGELDRARNYKPSKPF